MKYKNKNILYLTWGENIVDYGIFESQVFTKLKHLASSSELYSFSILCGIPLGKKYLADTKRYEAKLDKIDERFRLMGIDFATRTLIKLSRHAHAPWWALPALHLPHLLFFRRYCLARSIDLVHCRSYNAAILALLARTIFRMNYKLLFDTRGLVPEEGVLIGAYGEGSFSYRLWKRLEKWLLNNSDSIVNVSDTFTEYISTRTDNIRLHTIYTGVDTDLFVINGDKRLQVGKELSIPSSAKVLAYAGSMGETGWHSPIMLAKLFKAFRGYFPCSILLIITTSDHAVMAKSLKEYDINTHDYRLVRGDDVESVSRYLQRGDYAAFSYRFIQGELEKHISHTVIAIKTGEYLAMGLPVLVNKNAGAAARLVNRHQVGIPFDPENIHESLGGIVDLEADYAKVRERCRNVACETFGFAQNAKRYLDCYGEMLT